VSTGEQKTELVRAEKTELTPRELALMAERKQLAISTAGIRPGNWNELITIAQTVYLSGLAPESIGKSWEQCAVAIGFALELGLPIMSGIQNIAVINGRASLWGDAVLALCQTSELFDHEAFEEQIGAESATCIVRRNIGNAKPVSRTFTLDDAKAAKLFPGKDRNGNISEKSPWNAYTKRMLQMRARMWALRDAFPDLLRGMRSIEELQDDPTPTTILQGSPPGRLPGESKSDHLANVLETRKTDTVSETVPKAPETPAVASAPQADSTATKAAESHAEPKRRSTKAAKPAEPAPETDKPAQPSTHPAHSAIDAAPAAQAAPVAVTPAPEPEWRSKSTEMFEETINGIEGPGDTETVADVRQQIAWGVQHKLLNELQAKNLTNMLESKWALVGGGEKSGQTTQGNLIA
jgi:hypothetical protein